MEQSYLTAATSMSESDISGSVHFAGEPEMAADVEALLRLSDNLGAAFLSPEFEFLADARIVLGGGREVRVHRCLLSARSPFLREEFARREEEAAAGAAPVRVELRDLAKDFEVGYDALAAVLKYLYTGRVAPLPKAACQCVDEECRHEACRPAVDFMAEVLYASFVFQISELVSLFQRRLLDVLEKVVIDDIPIVLSVAKLCEKYCGNLLGSCIEMVIKSDLDMLTIEKTMPLDIVEQITVARRDMGLVETESNGLPDKHVRRIHRSLDCDDVELLRMLLVEGNATLDDACALHYAVAYCDPKITTDLLDLALADVNHRNLRRYTVLHMAAMRKEPNIIASLLTKGARPSDLTPDGRKALEILKRLTRSAEYMRSTEEGEATPKSRLCIEILEEAERSDPRVGEASVSLAIAGDDMRGKLLYLENRVALARLLFPVEARVAMDIAQVDGTLEFNLGSANSHISPGNQRTAAMDLNEAPFKIKEEHLARIRALSRTVQLGKRFFPRCSNVIDKIMDDDVTELTGLGHNSSEERKRRFLELQDALSKAFGEDKEEFDRSAISSSSSSTSAGVIRGKR